MTTNQTPEDKELEALKGKVPGLEDVIDDTKPTPPAAGDEPKDGEGDDKPDDDAEDDEPSEDEPEKGEDEDDEADDPEDDEDEPAKGKKPQRPETYIPIAQYTDEKKRWKGTVDEKDKRIADLEAMVKDGGKPNSQKFEAAVKRYMDKYGVDEETAKADVERVGIIMEGYKNDDKPAPKKDGDKPELDEETQNKLAELDEIKAEKAFNEEFSTVATPELKKYYPNATPEQLAKAKKEIEKIACSRPYLDKSLDYVVFKNRSVLDKVFKAPRVGVEGKGAAPDKGKQGTYTSDDFVGGKTNFSVLASLPVEEQNAIVEKLPLKDYEAWTHYINMNDPVVINRKGRKF